jgi:HD-GYP domain-containing protein (c-di-GMP phosphodiesterase class II)
VRGAARALAEVKAKSGSQFCPRCVSALTRILPLESVVSDLPAAPQQQRTLVKAS